MIGLISLVTMMLYVGLLLGPIGLLLSIDGLRTARRFKGVTWPAIIGIITSGVTTAILLAVIVVSVR